ncbi:hypothetical protein BI335_18810 [Enemella evansiae]|uniref:hypothetical protein n=1 Tax=Enemella evansiae TaxID=2016499 RepID=UPI000B97A8DA|nr:hypothetical protein [Enemella evansiae]OYO09382.1 hypothetical protein BI335_18810 [Enemella evansiae]
MTITTMPTRQQTASRHNQGSSESQRMLRERQPATGRYQAPVVERWTPELVTAFMRASRLTKEEVAKRAEVHPKTVERWQLMAARKPFPRHQRVLDALLSEASEAVQVRFCQFAGLRPVRQVEAPGSEWEDCRAELARLSEVLDRLTENLEAIHPETGR